MSGRSRAVLERFPCHLALADPGKRFGRIVEDVTDELDVVTRQMADVRRAHRLSETPTMTDLTRLGALHSIASSAYALVALRHEALKSLGASDTALLSVYTNLLVAELDALEPAGRAEATARLAGWPNLLSISRDVVSSMVTAHRIGNGTAAGLLTATGGLLGFDIDPDAVTHSDDRWWHLVSGVDRLVDDFDLATAHPDLFALEENPTRDASTTPVPRHYADRFALRRGGLEDVTTAIVVVGTGNRTVAPMVVNVDAGQGVVYDAPVPDGAELVFETSGQVYLDGDDVTGAAFSFTGAVFADALGSHATDMLYADTGAVIDTDSGISDETDGEAPATTNTTGTVIDDGTRVATFVVTSPVSNGFGPSPALPHGGSVGGLPLPLGESRWAFFVRVAHFGVFTDGSARAAVARSAAGLFEESVFADITGRLLQTSGDVGFRWEEREPFAVRLHLPSRLAIVDDDDGTMVREPLRALLDRHRAAGVHLTVTYAEPRWEIGSGVVRPLGTAEAIGTVIDGTTLWPDGTPQPTPDGSTSTPTTTEPVPDEPTEPTEPTEPGPVPDEPSEPTDPIPDEPTPL